MPAFHQAAAASSSTTPGQPKGDAPVGPGRHCADQGPGDHGTADVTEGQDRRDAFEVSRVEAFRQDARHRRPTAGLHQSVDRPEHEHRRQGRLKAEGQIHQRAGQQAEADDVEGANMAADLAPEEVAEGVGPEERQCRGCRSSARLTLSSTARKGSTNADIHAAQNRTSRRWRTKRRPSRSDVC